MLMLTGGLCIPLAQTSTDPAANVNNQVDVRNFRRDDEIEADDNVSDDEAYGTEVPDDALFTKEPPYLPPQLRHILLNAEPAASHRGIPELPPPLPVTLDHLYCTAIREGVMVQGVTRRFRRKYTSTVFYSMMPTSPTLRIAQAAGWSPPPRAAGDGDSSTVDVGGAAVAPAGVSAGDISMTSSAAAAVAGPSAAGMAGASAAPGASALAASSATTTASAAAPSAATAAPVSAGVAAATQISQAQIEATAAALTPQQSEALLVALRQRLETVALEMHQAALRDYYAQGQPVTHEQSERLFAVAKSQAHQQLLSRDAQYVHTYRVLQVAQQRAQAAAAAAEAGSAGGMSR